MEARKHSGIEMVVFGWENVLLGLSEIPAENNPHIPQLTFRQPIKDIFARLNALQIKIYIISDAMSNHDLQEYLSQNGIVGYDKACCSTEFDSNSTTDLGDGSLEAVKYSKWQHVADFYEYKNNQICIVDNPDSCRYIAKQREGIICIPVTPSEKIYLNNPDHLFNVLDICLLSHINNAIENYIPNHKPGILSYLFCDVARGTKRAEKYLTLLNHPENTPFSRLLTMFALFASEDGETIQKYAYKTLNFANRENAEEWFRNQINTWLGFLEKSNAAVKKILNEYVIEKIVEVANFENQAMTDAKMHVFLEIIARQTGIKPAVNDTRNDISTIHHGLI